MTDLEAWFSAYLAVLAGGMSTEKARSRAYIALDDYNRVKEEIDKCQVGHDVVKSTDNSGI